jgi:ESX secretion system ATPase EccB
MATRRDELSAHSFARKRMLAAFLQPDSRVSDEGAPRPVKAFMPSTVMGVVLVAGCIAWGAISPSAPPGWDKPGEHIIVDSTSTTRYVVLNDTVHGKKVEQLHPVLNFASAKLVLNKGKGDVIEVAGEDIDKSDISRGATIGIPYAPDRLPSPEKASKPKEWAICDKPGSTGEAQEGVFVMAGKDDAVLQGKGRLGNGEALYVEGPPEKPGDEPKRYIVDGNGTKLLLQGKNANDRDLLTKLVLKNPGQPQKVSQEWLDKLNTGDPLQFPTLNATPATPVSFTGSENLPTEARRVGMVLESTPSGTPYYYVVLKDRVQQITPLLASILMGGQRQQTDQKPVHVDPVSIANIGGSRATINGGKGWPETVMRRVNTEAQGIGSTSHLTSCSIYTGKTDSHGARMAAWVGHDFPAHIVNGSSRAYVTPGAGLLYQESTGTGGGGQQYLLTDSGLRYALGKDAKTRLGYGKTKVAHVPKKWSDLLPKGPTLSTTAASQEQGM